MLEIAPFVSYQLPPPSSLQKRIATSNKLISALHFENLIRFRIA